MKKIISFLLIILIIIAQTGCSVGNFTSAGKKQSFGEDWLLNTYCSITIFEKNREDVITEAFAYARSLESKLSRTVSTSDVYKFNESAEGITVCSELAELTELSQEYYKLSGGLFDISIGAVSQLWDFTAENPQVPDASEIQKALSFTQKTESLGITASADGSTALTKSEPGITLDFGGIAKGYIADKVKEFLEDRGVKTAVISLGGNIVLIGNKADGTAWQVGIEQPFSGEDNLLIQDRSIVGLISVNSGSVVSSGTYERKFTDENGHLYHHILNPTTGYPADTDLNSASVCGPESARCDALSTICLMLGSEKALEFIESVKDYEAVLIKADGSVLQSSGAAFSPIGGGQE